MNTEYRQMLSGAYRLIAYGHLLRGANIHRTAGSFRELILVNIGIQHHLSIQRPNSGLTKIGL
ncbi:MAG TPA: hypothetical protein ENM98_04865 [Halothiobacillaceae bacterium]|nr:hypothetical protein [Halothiobacillaceae bacterium]